MSSDEFFSPFADETCKRGFSRVENGTAGGGRRKENEEKEEGIPGHYRFLLSTSFQLVTEDLRLCIREHLVVARVFFEISIHSNRIPTRRGGSENAPWRRQSRKSSSYVHIPQRYTSSSLVPSSLVTEKLRVIRGVAERLIRWRIIVAGTFPPPSTSTSSYFSSNRILSWRLVIC